MSEFSLVRRDGHLLRPIAGAVTTLALLGACARPGEGVNQPGAQAAASAEASASPIPEINQLPPAGVGVFPETVTDPAGAAVFHDDYAAGGIVDVIPAGSHLGISCYTESGSTGEPLVEIGDGRHIGEYTTPEAVGLADTYRKVLPDCAAAVSGA